MLMQKGEYQHSDFNDMLTNNALISNNWLMFVEMGPWFKVSSEGLEQKGLPNWNANHCAMAVSVLHLVFVSSKVVKIIFL